MILLVFISLWFSSVFGTIDRIIDDIVVIESNIPARWPITIDYVYMNTFEFNDSIFEGAVINNDFTVNYEETKKRKVDNLNKLKEIQDK